MAVSIPFVRESVSQVSKIRLVAPNGYEVFRFPSCGKAYRKRAVLEILHSNPPKFPFPSNGKAYRKISGRLSYTGSLLFPFPSTGKAYRKIKVVLPISSTLSVSIPFDRESVSQDRRHRLRGRRQFRVSIPFHRESVSKAFWECGP